MSNRNHATNEKHALMEEAMDSRRTYALVKQDIDVRMDECEKIMDRLERISIWSRSDVELYKATVNKITELTEELTDWMCANDEIPYYERE